MIKLDRVLKGFNLQHGTELKSYASFAFTNAIKDMLRQRQAVEVCTDWALLHKVSQKRLGEALQNFGLNAATSQMYSLAWQCFKTIYAPTDLRWGYDHPANPRVIDGPATDCKRWLTSSSALTRLILPSPLEGLAPAASSTCARFAPPR